MLEGKKVIINSVLMDFDANSKGLKKTGDGILELRGVNTFTGPFEIREGKVVIAGTASLAMEPQLLLMLLLMSKTAAQLQTLGLVPVMIPVQEIAKARDQKFSKVSTKRLTSTICW